MLILGNPWDFQERNRHPERRSRGVQDQGPKRSHQQAAQVRCLFRYISIPRKNCMKMCNLILEPRILEKSL